MKTAIVIGSGIAGIASALRAKHKGYHVKVFEAYHAIGGKMQEIHEEGFRFDKGPSLFTLPYLVDELFLLFNKKPEDYYSYEALDTSCHYFWEDSNCFKAKVGFENFSKAASEYFDEDRISINRYLESSKEKYNLTSPLFIEKSLHLNSTYLNKKTLHALSQIYKLDLFQTLHDYNRKKFHNEKLVQLFDRYATYNGSNPYETTAIMSMIPYLELGLGTYFPKEGIRSIVDGLYQLAIEEGVEFYTNQKIDEIVSDSKGVNGISIQGKLISAEVVISNSDVFYTYKNLLPEHQLPRKIENEEKSSSGMIFYWGVKGKNEHLDLHNIFFSRDYEQEFQEIFKGKGYVDDPTVYVNITSKLNKRDAPKDHENWFVMVNTSADQGQEWDKVRDRIKKSIIKKINAVLDIHLEDRIVFEEYLDPKRISTYTLSHKGALYGSSSNKMMSAFLRHPNFNPKVKNLYFCGGSVHPGGGIPLCLNSAKIVGHLIPSVA